MIRNTIIHNINSLNNNNHFVMNSTNDINTMYNNNSNNKESCNTINDNKNNNINQLSYCIVWSPIHPITWILPFIGHMGICTSTGIGNDFRGPYSVGTDGQLAFGPATRILLIVNVATVDDDNTNTFLSKTCNTTTTTVIHSSSSSIMSTTEIYNNTFTDESIANKKEGNEQHQQHTITQQQWDDTIVIGNNVYKNRMHNICCDNCHSHVALILNTLNIQYQSFWTFGRTIHKNSWNMIVLAYLLFVHGTFISYLSILQQFGPFCILLFLILYFNL